MMILKPPLLPVGIEEFLTLFLNRLYPSEMPMSFLVSISSMACLRSALRCLNFLPSCLASLRNVSPYSIIQLVPQRFDRGDSVVFHILQPLRDREEYFGTLNFFQCFHHFFVLLFGDEYRFDFVVSQNRQFGNRTLFDLREVRTELFDQFGGGDEFIRRIRYHVIYLTISRIIL